MMKKERNKNLTHFNTFGLKSLAKTVTFLTTKKDFLSYDWFLNPLVLGGGSNVLLPEHIEHVVISNSKKRSIVKKDTTIYVTVGAGIVWKNLVIWCAKHSIYGLENLAAIPGTVGGAVVQNIGAYGVEISQFVEKVLVFNTAESRFHNFSQQDCQFDYRFSCFKKKKSPLIVKEVVLKLSTLFTPSIEFKELAEHFKTNKLVNSMDLVTTITKIRSAKLPNWKEFGNIGSFFKNPIVTQTQFDQLKEKYILSGYVTSSKTDKLVKLSAAQLIDIANLKGLTVGGARVSFKHSLVLENFNQATQKDVITLKNKIIDTIKTLFTITLEEEVIIYD
jgi:UDP-N-acetylmuramate dehydrogenase